MIKLCILVKNGRVMDIYSDYDEIDCTVVDYDEHQIEEEVFVIHKKDMQMLVKKIQKEL